MATVAKFAPVSIEGVEANGRLVHAGSVAWAAPLIRSLWFSPHDLSLNT